MCLLYKSSVSVLTSKHNILRSYPALAEKNNIDSESGEPHVKEESSKLMDGDDNNDREKEERPLQKAVLAPFESTREGWREYFRHSVRYAGIGLALLYMTVLGFDNITYGTRVNHGSR